ncbi:hypothetical protein SK128_012928 [Halocaridina rubra]|uniref:Uncharacterized protein n=1 Tax=Halocaridina rubra TaxID=373956 RepID=A0AAN9AD91_HALRR
MTALTKLNGLMVQSRRMNVQLAKRHWRNTNEKTVLFEDVENEAQKEETSSKLTTEEINATILQICQQQWQQHCRRNRDRGKSQIRSCCISVPLEGGGSSFPFMFPRLVKVNKMGWN